MPHGAPVAFPLCCMPLWACARGMTEGPGTPRSLAGLRSRSPVLHARLGVRQAGYWETRCDRDGSRMVPVKLCCKNLYIIGEPQVCSTLFHMLTTYIRHKFDIHSTQTRHCYTYFDTCSTRNRHTFDTLSTHCRHSFDTTTLNSTHFPHKFDTLKTKISFQ